jgi:hypothetical protein
MRFIILHKTNAHWEAGAIPSRALITRVGGLIGELAKSKALLGAEGLRATSHGVRVRFAGGTRTIVPGPFTGEHEVFSGFTILRVATLDEAIEWATTQAAVLGDEEVDIRPVTEPWDINLAAQPKAVSTRRYMVLRKATRSSAAGEAVSSTRRADTSKLLDETKRAGKHVATVTLRPSARGRRYKNSREGVSVIDGPFAESKELIAGYVIVMVDSWDDANRWALRYLDVVEAGEIDVYEVEDLAS